MLSSAIFADDNVSLLKEADSLKSRDPHTFQEILHTLESRSYSFSLYEANYYKYLQAFLLSYTGESAHAIEHFKEVYNSAKNVDLKIRALTSAINMFGITRNYVDGYKYAQQLITIVPKASKEVRESAYTGLSIFYNQLGEYKLGLFAANKVLEEAEDKRLICFADHSRIEAQSNLDLIISPSSADSAINYCLQIKEFAAALFNIVVKARLHKNLGEVDQAIAVMEDNVEVFNKAFYPVAKADYKAELAQLYFLKKEFLKAKVNAEESIQLSIGAGMFRSRIDAFEVLYKYYEVENDVAKAYHYFQEYYKTQKAFLDEVKLTQLAIQQTKFDAQEKANQIALLNKENSLLKTQAELAQREIDNSRLVIATLVLLASIVVVWLLFNHRMNIQLKTQAQTDELTGIANRHYFTNVAEKALSYHKKTGQHLTVVVFDLDFFKNVNDTHGHVIGDWALKAVVSVVQRVCRNQDVFGRLGGEEFAILLPGCGARKAQSITESCRSAIAAIDTSETGEQFNITASFGVADTKLCGYKFQHLYACADKAMYRSKDEGRNRVYVYDGCPPESFTLDEKFS
ncbi:GGDEF domain-containing protein [Alteromonas ponticola]|uniref:diguanylate cyclase n=1 Tax=Alteromonas aquimaris TaxID=2998417 RepID=A0ABT3P4X3_9ALTE|nr:GGDEF domain-containing protein [Alteromonas aquimaris]MCW8107815.1 GGDEF domain-containing protein [Alteromonas aquimaris]